MGDTVTVLMSKLILAAALKTQPMDTIATEPCRRQYGFQVLCRPLKMNFIFKMADAILTLHAAEAY